RWPRLYAGFRPVSHCSGCCTAGRRRNRPGCAAGWPRRGTQCDTSEKGAYQQLQVGAGVAAAQLQAAIVGTAIRLVETQQRADQQVLVDHPLHVQVQLAATQVATRLVQGIEVEVQRAKGQVLPWRGLE